MNNFKFYDLTIPQKSIYLTEEYASGSSVNLIGGNIIIDEPVNLDFLEKALNIAYHEKQICVSQKKCIKDLKVWYNGEDEVI